MPYCTKRTRREVSDADSPVKLGLVSSSPARIFSILILSFLWGGDVEVSLPGCDHTITDSFEVI